MIRLPRYVGVVTLLLAIHSSAGAAAEAVEVFPPIENPLPPRGENPDAPADTDPQRTAGTDGKAPAKSPKKDKTRHTVKTDKKALALLKDFVGTWHGQGQLKRRSNKGAWTADAQWRWDFTGGRAALVFTAKKFKYYKSGRLLPGDEPGTFVLSGTLPDGKTVERFTGRLDARGRLVLAADKLVKGRPVRITLRLVAGGARLIIRYDKYRGRLRKRTMQLAEIGYTRKGSGFGRGPRSDDCIVTGGKSETTVSYQGKSYPVCCSGCKDAFREDPAGILKEWRERVAREKAAARKP